MVGEHRLSELIQPLAAGEPTGRNDHRQVTWLQRLCLLDEVVIDGCCARSKAAVTELIRRVANDYVELHIASKQLGQASLDVVGVDERVGVGFEAFAAVEDALTGPAVFAAGANPRVLGAFEPDRKSTRLNSSHVALSR